MSIITYKRGTDTALTANFKQHEFDCKGHSCKCGCGCKTTPLDTKLIRKLQVLRNWTGKPITVNSGRRCETHNRCQGSAPGSYHVKGQAADIVIAGMTPAQVAKLAQEVGFVGVGRYRTFTHVDTRTVKYMWIDGKGAVSTHSGKRKKCPHSYTSVEELSVGSKGTAVRAVQWILNWAGYPCKVDGDFGGKTKAAVMDFQRDMLLTADGVVGYVTRCALKEVSA
ncbi:MAG: DUF882 domain-containing protein [Ruminococcaceae bacterium]|nr:DUF882 domain-containing protein [Oscillospiraceae bacterium]